MDFERVDFTNSQRQVTFSTKDPTRYLVNDACVLLGKPNVYGSIFRFEGQTTVTRWPPGNRVYGK